MCAERLCACGALVRPRAARSTRTLGMTTRAPITGLHLTLAIINSTPAMTADAPAEIYLDLRSQALAQTPHSLVAEADVVGVLMETRYPEAVATLVAFIDGSASMYFSNGGGIIGAGQHEGPAAAARALVQVASEYLRDFVPTKEFPLPEVAHTRFYVVTRSGVLTAEAAEQDLGEGRLPLSPVFHAAHELIFQIRQAEEHK